MSQIGISGSASWEGELRIHELKMEIIALGMHDTSYILHQIVPARVQTLIHDTYIYLYIYIYIYNIRILMLARV